MLILRKNGRNKIIIKSNLYELPHYHEHPETTMRVDIKKDFWFKFHIFFFASPTLCDAMTFP
jgi:hypothetical protein